MQHNNQRMTGFGWGLGGGTLKNPRGSSQPIESHELFTGSGVDQWLRRKHPAPALALAYIPPVHPHVRHYLLHRPHNCRIVRLSVKELLTTAETSTKQNGKNKKKTFSQTLL